MRRFLAPLKLGKKEPSLWLLRPLSLITAYLLAVEAPNIGSPGLRVGSYVILSVVLLWCVIWLIWHLRNRLRR